ncbi:glycosyltransferase [Verrucomicrobiaceae bacterium 227]
MSRQGWRWGAYLASLILLLGVAIQWSRLETIQSGGFERIILFALAWVGMMGAVFAFPKCSRRQGFLMIALAGLVLRLVLWPAPVSDDVNRYLWEGSLVWKGENPYETTADDEARAHLRDDHWEAMNHRDRLTAYPPGMELLAAGASWLWYDLQVFKILALAGDLWSLAMLGLLLKATRRPIRWLGLYAFNPVVLISFAAEAHFDSLMVGALLTALYLARQVRWSLAWFWLGVAVQMKFMAILLVPYFLVRGDRRKILPFLLVLAIPALPFFGELSGGLRGLLGFGSSGAFNGGIYETFRSLGIGDSLARLPGMMLFLGVGLIYGWRTLRGLEKDLIFVTQMILAALVMGSPVVHFWYLSWLIPFVVLRPSLSWLTLCLTISIYFLAWENEGAGGTWGYHRGWVLLTWWPFFILHLVESRWWRSRSRQRDYPEVASVDIVVPVYNPGGGIRDFLDQLRQVSPGISKIIVVDGGSSDGSLVHVGPHLTSERGRGRQIAAGVAESSADLVAIVHADTVPVEGWVEQLMAVANAHPRSPAFALGQRFCRASPGLLLVEMLNEARAIFSGSVFGDQTLIIRREALVGIGGFPAQPLMEDVEVSWRLLEKGPITYLGQEWTVSSQKWRGRFVARFHQVIGLMIRYRLARRKGRETAEELSFSLYREYYGEEKASK